MGMSIEEFYAITPAEFYYAMYGWHEGKQLEMRAAWERERWSLWHLCCIQLEHKSRKPMTVMFPLPWDAETPEQTPISNQDRRAACKDISNRYKHLLQQ